MSTRRRRARKRERRGAARPASHVPAPPSKTRLGFVAAHRRRFSQAVAAVTATVGLLVGITSLIDWTRRVDPEPPPAPEIDARISSVELRSRNEPFEDYLVGTAQSTDDLTSAELAEEGLVFAIRVRFKGSTEAKFPTRWSLYDARRRAPLPDNLYTQAVGTFTPKGPDHARTWLQWVPYPPEPGRYFLRVTVTDDKRRPAASRDSRAFPIARIPPV
jgi:hypothetical protein